MTLSQETHNELDELLAKWREDELNTTQVARLDEIVRHNSAARKRYLTYVGVYASLRWLYPQGGHVTPMDDRGETTLGDVPATPKPSSLEQPGLASDTSDVFLGGPVDAKFIAEALDEADVARDAVADAEGSIETDLTEIQQRPKVSRKKKWDAVLSHSGDIHSVSVLSTPWLIGISAVVAIVAAFYFLLPDPSANGASTVAVLTASVDARWATPATTTTAGDELAAGEYRLKRGRVWIMLRDGAQVGIMAPASFTLQDSDRMFLSHGKLVGFCSPAARGFAVQTRDGTFVDLGTEFGIQVGTEGVTEVHVLAGEVAVRPVSTSAQTEERFVLVAGQARRINSQDGSVEVIALSVDAFSSLRPLLGRNLIVNGDFEIDEPGEVLQNLPPHFRDITITGWDDRNGAMTLAYNQPPGGGDFPKPGRDAVPTNHGRCFFMSTERESVTSQTIDVSALRDEIDARQIGFQLAGWIGGYADQDDTLTIRAVALDSRGEETLFAQLGPIHARERNNETGFWELSKEGELPVGTRQLRIDLVARSFDPSTTNIPDAYADNVSLTLSLEQPAATAK